MFKKMIMLTKKLKKIANNLNSGIAIAHRVSWFSVFIVEAAFMIPFLGLPFVLLVNGKMVRGTVVLTTNN